jgi:hypothetical protein
MGLYELTMVICSIVQQECSEPHVMPTTYETFKQCVQAGHKEAYEKFDDLNSREVNRNMIHIKFACVKGYNS